VTKKSPATDADQPAATSTIDPAVTDAPTGAPAPLTEPDGGGSYVRDPVTGHLTRKDA